MREEGIRKRGEKEGVVLCTPLERLTKIG